MIALRSWFFLWGVALLLWSLGRNVVELIHLRKLKKKLLLDGRIDHHKDWKERSVRYHAVNFIRRGLILLWFMVLLLFVSSSIMEENLIPLSDYEGDPPFATMADLAAMSCGPTGIRPRRTNSHWTSGPLLCPLPFKHPNT